MVDKIKALIEFLVKNGVFPEWLANNIGVALIIFPVVFTIGNFLWGILKKYFLDKNQQKISQDLHPYFTIEDVRKATQYYIPTRFQNVAPSEDDEPGRQFLAVPKDNLLKFFLKKAFPHQGDSNRFYLIMADSGMGKTTFMINLFLKYKNQKTWFWSMPKYDIRLLPLGAKEALAEVDKIENKRNTILLLDAFDEDIEALNDYRQRMNLIVDKIKEFREVVITCRTQFFPSKDEEPHETKIFTFGDSSNSQIKFQKSYISVFDDKDIVRYIKKRFSFLHIFSRAKAFKIARDCPNLMVRPMLLSHIEDLINSKKTFNFTYQIYEALIDKWIERESSKPGIIEKFGSTVRYGSLLLDLSEKLALNLYENREKRKGYSIYKDEKIEDIPELQLSELEKEYSGLGREIKSKSLLNRNGDGFYKFSHKSILEYFLAKILSKYPNLLKNFDFSGMDMALLFHKEIVIQEIKRLNGSFIADFPYISGVTLSNNYPTIDRIINRIFNSFYSVIPSSVYHKIGLDSILNLNDSKFEIVFKSLVKFNDKNNFKISIKNCSRFNPLELSNFRNAERIFLSDKDVYSVLYKLLDLCQCVEMVKMLGLVKVEFKKGKDLLMLDKKVETLLLKLKEEYGLIELYNYFLEKRRHGHFQEAEFYQDNYYSNKIFENIYGFEATVGESKYPISLSYIPDIERIPYLYFVQDVNPYSFNFKNETFKLIYFNFPLSRKFSYYNIIKKSIDENKFLTSSDLSDNFTRTIFFSEIQVLLSDIEDFFCQEQLFNDFIKVNEFIKDAQKLQERLPKCEVIF